MTPILARQRPDRTFERLYKKHAGDVYRYALPGKEEEWKKDPMYEIERKYQEGCRMVEELLAKPLRARAASL